MSKKIIATTLSLVMLLSMTTACGNSESSNTAKPVATTTNEVKPTDNGETVVLKLGHALTEKVVLHQAMLSFAENVNKRSNGKIRVDVYANAQLGNERDMIEGMQLGTVDLVYCATAVMSNFVPSFSVMDAPFLYSGSEHIFKVADGEIGKSLCDEALKSQNIHILGFMDAGDRHVFSTKPVRTIEDFKGLKIRTMENDMHISMFNMLGAQATPMAFGELYTALQQGTVDAGESSYQGITGSGFDEICKYVTDTGHVYSATLFCIGENSFQKIPDEYKDMVLEEGTNATLLQRKLVGEENLKAVKEMEANGVEMIHIDREPLIEATKEIYTKFADKLPADLVEKIRAVK